MKQIVKFSIESNYRRSSTKKVNCTPELLHPPSSLLSFDPSLHDLSSFLKLESYKHDPNHQTFTSRPESRQVVASSMVVEPPRGMCQKKLQSSSDEGCSKLQWGSHGCEPPHMLWSHNFCPLCLFLFSSSLSTLHLSICSNSCTPHIQLLN